MQVCSQSGSCARLNAYQLWNALSLTHTKHEKTLTAQGR